MWTLFLLIIHNLIFGVQAWGAGASHNACLHTESLSFDDAIVLLTVFEMLLC